MGVCKVNFDDNDINKLLDKSYMSRSKVKGLYNPLLYGNTLLNFSPKSFKTVLQNS